MALKEPIPLLRLFGQWQPTGYLAELAQNCIIHCARFHQEDRSADLVVTFGDLSPEPASLRALGTVLAGCYGMSRVTFRLKDAPQPVAAEEERPPLPEESPLPEEPPAMEEDVFQQTAALREAALRENASRMPQPEPAKARQERSSPAVTGDMIFGKGIHRRPIPMKDVSLDMGMVAVCGKVFFIEHRELPKRKAWVINFYITDNTNSLIVAKFMENRVALPVIEKIKKGM